MRHAHVRQFRPVRAFAAFTAAGLAAASLAACGGSSSAGGGGQASNGSSGGTKALTPVTFQLNFFAGGSNAGFSVALQKGLYRKAGLDVKIVQGTGSTTTAQLVASGRANLAYADAVPVMQLIAKGAPMKIVSVMYQSNPNAVTVLANSQITSFAQLKGKSIGVPNGGSQTAMIPLLLKSNGLTASDVKLVNLAPTALPAALLRHQVDAILGSLDAYGPEVEAQGAKVREFPFYNHGVATLSTSIFASNSYLASHGSLVKKFIAASAQGWEMAKKDPAGAISDLQKTFPSVKDPKLNQAELEGAIPLLCANGATEIGHATTAAWNKTTQILQQTEGLTTSFPASHYHTDAYLPSSLPAC